MYPAAGSSFVGVRVCCVPPKCVGVGVYCTALLVRVQLLSNCVVAGHSAYIYIRVCKCSSVFCQWEPRLCMTGSA